MKLGQCRSQFLAKAQTIGDCGRRIRISVCSPSFHYKTSKPQIQQQGTQGGLSLRRLSRSSRHSSRARTAQLVALTVVGGTYSRYKSQTSCLATLEGQSVSSAVLESCRFLFSLRNPGSNHCANVVYMG